MVNLHEPHELLTTEPQGGRRACQHRSHAGRSQAGVRTSTGSQILLYNYCSHIFSQVINPEFLSSINVSDK